MSTPGPRPGEDPRPRPRQALRHWNRIDVARRPPVVARTNQHRAGWLSVTSSAAPGQICRDRTRDTFKIAIVLGPSIKSGKLRVCRWQSSNEPSGGHWSAPCALFEEQLEALTPDFDLTSRRGLIVAAAKRTVINGLVRWQVGVHDIGTGRP